MSFFEVDEMDMSTTKRWWDMLGLFVLPFCVIVSLGFCFFFVQLVRIAFGRQFTFLGFRAGMGQSGRVWVDNERSLATYLFNWPKYISSFYIIGYFYFSLYKNQTFFLYTFFFQS